MSEAACARQCQKMLMGILADNEKRRQLLRQELDLLDGQDARVRRQLHDMAMADEESGARPRSRKKKVFRPDISERMMADILHEVYERVIGGSGKSGKGVCDISPIDLIAYLFIMVDTCHYGRDDFHTNGKRPFFEFFVEKVRPELRGVRGITRETMGNRINKEFDCLYQTAREKERLNEGMRRHNRGIEKNFETVCGIFHKLNRKTV